MKFLCGSCRTKYQISEERVRGKILTIRCQKCGAKVLVRESLVKDTVSQTAIAPMAGDIEAEEPAEVTIKQKVVAVAGRARPTVQTLNEAFDSSAEDEPTSIATTPDLD